MTWSTLFLTLFSIVISLAGCSSTSSPPRIPTIIDQDDSLEANTEWTLVWSDEFEGNEGQSVNQDNWVFDLGGHGWGNQQLEFNTDRSKNASLNGEGMLQIIAYKEEYQGNSYTSARLTTRNKVEYQYGRFEARIRLPRGAGIWPAFWLLGGDHPTQPWPDCGEIDIMEFRGNRVFESTGALHGPGFSGGDSLGGQFTSDTALTADFHIYAIEWDSDSIKWFVDQTLFFTAKPSDLPKGSSWPYQSPFFIILNLAVGGNYIGPPTASTQFPQTMLVDYVRIYQHLDR